MERTDRGRLRAILILMGNAVSMAIGGAILSFGPVSARGPESGSPYALFLNDGATNEAPSNNAGAAAPAIASRARKNTFAGQAVCVRLCDGAFFPLSSSASHYGRGSEATCGSLCPDAPTALYRERAGSDKIEDAVSVTGAPYTTLPVALRYRTTLDKTCTCHRSPASRLTMTRDATLRKGDYVMTPKGFVVFEGSKQYPYGASDFASLTASALTKDRRDLLTAMESISQSHSGTTP